MNYFSNKKIAILSNTSSHIWNMRREIINNLKKNKNSVYTISPKTIFFEELKKNTNYIPIKISRSGKNIFYEIKTIWQLYKIFKKENFDLIHTFTVKLNIYGAIASKIANKKTKIVSQVTGLGYVFNNQKSNKIMRFIIMAYKFAFNFSDKVIFQNNNDLYLFVKKNIVKKNKCYLIKGSGVNLKEYSLKNINKNKILKIKKELKIKKNIVVSLIARMLWSKGIKEYIESIKIIKQKYQNVLFLLIGDIDKDNPDFIPEKYIKEQEKLNLVKFIVFSKKRDYYKELIYISDIVVLPSYGEGVPKTLLEAMSMERPIITTYAPGCSETVKKNKNGFLIPVKNSILLSKAIKKLIINAKLRKKFGKYSRKKAENEFDEKIIAEKTIKIYSDALNIKTRKL